MVAEVSGTRILWLSALETALCIDRMPPEVADATANTVKKTTAVKATPRTPPLGKGRPGRRCALAAHRERPAWGVGPTQEDEPCRTIHAIATKSPSCFSVVTASA